MTEPVGGEVETPDAEQQAASGQGRPSASAGPHAVSDGAAPAGQESLTDFEGPRRRARREREQRRAAQARARAIEEARREAKRRLIGTPGPPKPIARGAVRGLKVLIGGVLLSVVAFGLGLVLYFTPVMSVRNVVIDGIQAVSRGEVVAAVAVRPGTPLLQVDTEKVADRVATIRRVASVRVQREYPSSLKVTVIERIPVVVKDYPDGPHLFDKDGVDFATAPPPFGLPYIDVDNPGPTDGPTKAALEVLTSLDPQVSEQVGRVAAPSVSSITLTLTDGRIIVWGTTDRTDEKADKLAALLTQPGHTYDLSSPDLPTVK